MIEFIEFPKLARLAREVIVTEKIDGTNAQVFIGPGSHANPLAVATWVDHTEGATDMVMLAGSRTRWITPEDDNFGFANWVYRHADELKTLGPGSHFGEWWGAGIQRKYGLTEKRWSLFNTSRWGGEDRPSCCHVVPTLYVGDFDTDAIDACLSRLRLEGSLAAPGFMKPEGVVVFHMAGRVGFKKTLEKDDVPKGMAA